MDLHCFGNWLILLLVSATGLTACGVPTANATPNTSVTADTFSAQQLPVSTAVPVTIISELPGEIQVISYPAQEVAIDAVSTDAENVSARVTLEFKNGGVLIQALNGGNAPDRLLLHVRVPHGSSVEVDAPRAAVEVVITGEVKNARVQLHQGNIVVRSATGDLNLRTDRGSIDADEHDDRGHTLELHANEGWINLFALNAKVVASTTNGSIQFVGTLLTASGESNNISEFTVTGAGDISIALPDNAKFRYRAFGGSRVVTDVARNTESCGLVSFPNYDFRRRALTGGDLGRIEVGGPITTTNQVLGTYGQGIVYFETNRNLITVFDPPNPPQRSSGPSGRGTIGDCGRLNTENLAVANIDLTAHADSGSIWIHQIDMK